MKHVKKLSLLCLLSGIAQAQEPVTLSQDSINAIVAAQIRAQGKCYEAVAKMGLISFLTIFEANQFEIEGFEALQNLSSLLREVQTGMLDCGISKDFLKLQFSSICQRAQAKEKQLLEKQEILRTQCEFEKLSEIQGQLQAVRAIALILDQINVALPA